MRPDDICMVVRFRNEEENYERFMRNNMELCSCFVGLDDRSDDLSMYYELSRHPKCAAIIRKMPGWTDMWDNHDKEAMYAICKTIGKPYILSIDLDEIIDVGVREEMLEWNDVDCVLFQYYFMYPDPTHRITSGVYADRWFPCLFRYNPEVFHSTLPKHRLHPDRVPCHSLLTAKRSEWYESKLIRAKSPVYHFSMDSAEKRARRYAFYQKYDGYRIYQSIGYDHLIAEYEFDEVIPRIL